MGDMRNLELSECTGSDTEDLLVTSMDARHLENCLGASIFIRREVDVSTQQVRQPNVGFPYQCYSSTDNDDEYPLLIHTRQDSEGYGSYQEPFVFGSSLYGQPAVAANGGEILKFQPGFKEFGMNSVYSVKDCDVFEECLKNDARGDKVCDEISTEKYGISEECPGEKARKDNKCQETSGEKYESSKECPNYQIENAESVEDVEILGECANESVSEIPKEYPNEKAEEENVHVETSADKYESPKECSNHQVGNAGSVEDFKIHEECAKKIVRGCLPCNAESLLSALMEAGRDLDTVYHGAGEMGTTALEAKRILTLHEEVCNSEQQASFKICVKPMGRKSSRRKKPTSSRKRVCRKSSTQKAENFVPSVDGIVDLLDSKNSEGFDVSTTPQIAAFDRPTHSSSVVSSTEETNDGINEVAMKLQAESETNDKDTVLSSNTNIVDKITGRITRSRAHGKVCMKTLVHDSLSDKSNGIFANKKTGRRSVLCKTVRSTVWRGLGNLREGLENTEIELKSELSCMDAEFDERNIEAEVIHNQQETKRGSGLRWQDPEKILEHHQSDHMKSPGSGRNCTKEKNDELERDGVESPGFVREVRESEEDRLNVQGGELLCSNGDQHSGGGTVRQKTIEEEHKCLEIQRDHCPTDQSKCYLRHEVPTSLTNMEKESTSHGHLSELGGTNVEDDVPHGDGCPTDVIQRDRCPTDQSKCCLPHEVSESPRKVEEDGAVHRHLSESCQTNIEAVVLQNYRGKRRWSGVKRQQPRKIHDSGQSQQGKFPVNASSRSCKKMKNEKQGNCFLQDTFFAIQSRTSEDHISNVQVGDVLCSSRDLHYGGGIVRQENTEQEHESLEIEKDQCPIGQSNCCYPLEVPKSRRRVEEKNKCTTNIEDEIAENRRRRKRGIAIQWQQPGKACDNGQSEQVKSPVFGSSRICRKNRNDRQEKAVIWDKGCVVETRGSEEHGSSVQGREFLCFNEDLHSGGGIRRQEITDKEHECLKSERDLRCSDQSKWHLPLEFPKSLSKVKEKNVTHGHSSEETICSFANETKSHVSSAIEIDASQEDYEENTNHIFDVLHEKNIASYEEKVAIPVKDICGISVDNSIKPLVECRNNTHAIAGTVVEMEQSGVKAGLEPAFAQDVPVFSRKLHNQQYIQHERELLDVKERSLEPNAVILQAETKTCHSEIATTEMYLKGCEESGTSMEVLDLCTAEHGGNDLHDMVSVTSHGEVTKAVAWQESGKKKGKVKEKFKSKSELSGIGLGVAEVTLGSLNTSQDQHIVSKMTKSRCKKTAVRAKVQERKSNLKNRRSLLYADSKDQVVIDEGLLTKELEGKASCESQETFNGEEMRTCVKEDPIVNVEMENAVPCGKGQARKNIKNRWGGNGKSESMGSTVICEKKRKATRQTNNDSDKKLSCGKSKQVRNGFQSLTRNNAKPAKGLHSLLSKNDLSNHETTQGKAVSADLSGIKGQSDSCTDAASSLKIADTSENEKKKSEDKHGLPSWNHNSEEKNVLETNFLERQWMAGCSNEVGVEDVSSVVNKGEANKIVNVVKYDESVERCIGSPRVGWVACDDCQKWRCIAVELIDAIGETNCKWTCQDNPNKKFADCSIPQEKSNAEINADLNISDASCEEGDYNGAPLISKYLASMQAQDSQQAFWTLIKHNRILHRSRKTQGIDEIMVCHCKLPEDGSYGCGDECLNRMLNIECVKETCPCGNLCSNQQFQKRLYAEVGLLRCGKKGFGLQVLQEIPKGLFIIEYVGEVLDMQVYATRQKEYASRGQKHFYFMTLDSNEVIDACVKGNLGRFINHSCDPNCRTEKWMVNGEVCIGLFAIRDIKKGEELTFDYNYVRVFGAAAKKCECSSAECKGFIGGDQSTPAVVVPSEPDDDHPIPVMLHEESENDSAQKNHVRLPKVHSLSDNISQEERSLQRTERKCQCTLAQNEKQVEFFSNCGTERSIGTPATGNTINLKKSIVQTNLGRFEGVEEKLNELLDSEGGICRRKDAAKQYLKLLLVTAASGNTSNGEASHSTRDLSMVLDALLKTRSRSVLLDIMNKNGLQMLHNMLKQNRNNFNKTPIIRKLLKVLEFLATKDVLTLDNINSGPLCRGRESLRASIYGLTGHTDWQVQQISRTFRDNWMLHPIKTFRNKERPLFNEPGFTVSPNRYKFPVKHQKNFVSRETDAIDCTSQTPLEAESVAQHPFSWSDQHEGSHGSHDNFPGKDSSKKLSEDHTSEGQMRGTRPRKRKSRWDQPAEPNVHQYFAQTATASVESAVKHEKESHPLILPSERESIAGERQDALINECKRTSEEKSVKLAGKNIPCTDSAFQSAPSSNPLPEEMSMLNGSNAFAKEQSSFQSTMQQTAQFFGHVHICLGSNHTPLCSTGVPCAQPFMMGYPQGKTVLGYAVGKLRGSVLPHLPLSYGIPLSLLEQLGRTPSAKVDSVGQPLPPSPLHCERNSNSMAATMLPNMSYRPFIGQPMAGGFPHTPYHQLRSSNIPLPIQSAHPLQSGRRQPLEMHPRDLLGQHISANSSYVQPEPPVPGLSPRGSLVNPQNSNRLGRGRNKTAYGQTLKPLKRHWKNHKSNFRTFSKFNGCSDRKIKDCFNPRKPLSFKSTWKGRLSSNFQSDQNLQHLPNGNIH